MFTKGITKVAITINKTLRGVASGLAKRTGESPSAVYRATLGGYVKSIKSGVPGVKTKDAIRLSKLQTTSQLNKASGGAMGDMIASQNIATRHLKNKG